VRVNIFARIQGDSEEFYQACADTRLSGARRVRIAVVGEERRD